MRLSNGWSMRAWSRRPTAPDPVIPERHESSGCASADSAPLRSVVDWHHDGMGDGTARNTITAEDIALDAVQQANTSPSLQQHRPDQRTPGKEATTGTDGDHRQYRAPAVGADVVVKPNKPVGPSFAADFDGHCTQRSYRCS